MAKGKEPLNDVVLKGLPDLRHSREASIESVVKTRTPSRKRRRVQSSPESSALSSPPTKLTSPPPSDEAGVVHHHSHPHTRSRRTNVKVLVTDGNSRPRDMNGSPVNGKRTSSRLNGAPKIHSFTPLLDNPESALRGLHKYRKRNSSANTTPNKAALMLKQTSGVDNDQYDGSSVGEVSPVVPPPSDVIVSDVDVHLDDPDVDAEGEEEVIDTVRFDLGDEDAEGEDDIDAEGEPE